MSGHGRSTMRLISGTLRSTHLLWLPVINIEPPALRRKAATDKLVEKVVKHDSWLIQPDILSPPLLRLTSRKPLWLDLQPGDIKSRWKHNWKSAQVVNSYLVCDPTIRQPSFDLPRQHWSLLNCFRTEQGHRGACRRKWWLTDTDLCPCGETQRMSHTVESCPLTKLNGGLSRLHSADEDAVSWLNSYGSWHAYEKKNRIHECDGHPDGRTLHDVMGRAYAQHRTAIKHVLIIINNKQQQQQQVKSHNATTIKTIGTANAAPCPTATWQI